MALGLEEFRFLYWHWYIWILTFDVYELDYFLKCMDRQVKGRGQGYPKVGFGSHNSLPRYTSQGYMLGDILFSFHNASLCLLLLTFSTASIQLYAMTIFIGL